MLFKKSRSSERRFSIARPISISRFAILLFVILNVIVVCLIVFLPPAFRPSFPLNIFHMSSVPPTKNELGRATWTAIHTLAAKYPLKPTAEEQALAKGFVMSLTKLYPCRDCAAHFDRFVSLEPPELGSRDSFLLWTCKAHNQVRKRQRKREFPCELKALEERWGDCGCKEHST